jgi:CHASE2 domain-containing sensor protein/predicted Ser/Thr protein kinase
MSDAGSRLFDEAVIARLRLRRSVALVVAALVALRVLAEVAPFMRRPDLVLLDAWQSLRGTQRPTPQVVVVGIDEKSIDKFGPPAWPRREYVPLIERLAKAGASVIGFDFTFGALEREAANNELMARAMKEAGNVVFGYEFKEVGDPSPPGTAPSEIVQANALRSFEAPALPPAPSLIEPEPMLAAAAAALGHISTFESEDGRIRRLPLFIQHGDKAYPSLAIQIARLYTKTPLPEIELRNGVVRTGAVDIPVSGSGEVLLNWPAAGEEAFKKYSFLDVVRGDVPDEAFKGKVVLVAGTASGLDDRDFPFAVEAPGVLIYATFLDNVFRADFVQAPLWAWLLEWGLFLAVCLLGVWLLPRLSTPVLLVGVPVLAALLLGGAAFLYDQQGVWVKVFYPGLALLAPLALLTALRLTASEKETRDVVAEKLAEEKLLGLSFQEKGLLDMALATFNKLPLTEDMKLVFLNLGLDYENRGLRDKAFLVYKKVFDFDPKFEDVARRMERLSQAMPSLFTGPTARVGATSVPSPSQATPGSPLAHLVETPLPSSEEIPTVVAPATMEAPRVPVTGIEEDFETRVGGPAPPQTHRLPPTQAGTGGRVVTPQPGRVTPQPGAFTPQPSRATPTPGGIVTPVPGGPVMVGSRFGRYEVERHLGRGGMGDVYVVRDTIINRKGALKTIRPDTELTPHQVIEVRQRFYREAQTAGRLTHPNIVTVYDVGEEYGMSYIVMEFVEGETLTQWMKKQRLSVAQIKHVIYHAAMGLDYAHENGVFHRDVKPDNIMISKTGLVKVMDFGIARIVESDLTKTGSVIGTPAYMSPEQVGGEKIDHRSDIFSLGVILYELLTGKKPFTGETIQSLMFAIIRGDHTQPSALDATVHVSWDQILKKALARNRDERYASAREFAVAVKDAPAR